MDIYIINSMDAKKAAKDAKRFGLGSAMLILFYAPDDSPDPDVEDALKKSFQEVGTYECPYGEHEIMLGVIKEQAGKKDNLYLIGPSLASFSAACGSQLTGVVSSVYISKTLNTEGKRPLRKTNKKKDRVLDKESKDVLSELLDLSIREQDADSRLNVQKNSPVDIPAKAHHPAKVADSCRATPIKKPMLRSPNKAQRDRKRTIENTSGDREHESQYSAVENAKADLCACFLDRIYGHIVKLCFSGYKDSPPMDAKETVPFIILLLRAYSRSLEKEKEAVGNDAPASNLDYGRIYSGTIDLFEQSWASTHMVIKITKDVLAVLLPEAQYYWRLTKMLYEEDLWENI